MITLTTFLKDHSNLVIAKCFLLWVDFFLYTLPEKQPPVNESKTWGSDLIGRDWHRKLLKYIKSTVLFPPFLRLKCYYHSQQRLQFLTAQPNWIHLLFQMFFIPLSIICLWPLVGGRNEKSWGLDWFPSFSLTLYSPFKFFSKSNVGRALYFIYNKLFPKAR